ncbi:hypothetical protein HN51_046650 [Arachis hypogaea]|nr:protein polybromo-1-like [Arachis hypogaea]QHO22850.1 Bromodomain and PHD finger-containing protein [Arachis hypogaea]
MTRLRKATAKEGKRRSPRISELMRPSGAKSHGVQNNRTTNKRKFQEFMASEQVEEHSHDHQHVKKKSDQQIKVTSSVYVPEKRILELVLDTLQRKDNYDIFAEPVDPNEVEDYYTIIEEPMDFGTMRAKLHEGMYKSLEQFEHDVFLIFNNAMHFNSSGTIYFRQARAIKELARKVFDVLKSSPEKFELEFSETKRKVVGRRNQGGFSRDSTTTTDMKSIISIQHTRKVVMSMHDDEGRDNLEVPIGGSKEGNGYKTMVDDKRCTYKPLSFTKDDSIFTTVYGKLNQLERVNKRDVGYKDSLMLFTKDLGPTAKNIAKRKILECEVRSAAFEDACRSDSNGNARRGPFLSTTQVGKKNQGLIPFNTNPHHFDLRHFLCNRSFQH